MNSVVKRKALLIEDDSQIAKKIHRSGCVIVETEVKLGIQPRVTLHWAIAPSQWRKGGAFLIFRNTSGFSAERHPRDLNAHGHLIVEAHENGTFEEHSAEATYYFTCLFHRRRLLWEQLETLRFSVTVPSAKVAITRLKEQKELRGLVRDHELEDMTHDAKLNEAELRLLESTNRLESAKRKNGDPNDKALPVDPTIAAAMLAIDKVVEASVAKRQKIVDLKRDANFRKLPKGERQQVIDRVEEALDPGEISARREMRGKDN